MTQTTQAVEASVALFDALDDKLFELTMQPVDANDIADVLSELREATDALHAALAASRVPVASVAEPVAWQVSVPWSAGPGWVGCSESEYKMHLEVGNTVRELIERPATGAGGSMGVFHFAKVSGALIQLDAIYQDLVDTESVTRPAWLRDALRIAELSAAPNPATTQGPAADVDVEVEK